MEHKRESSSTREISSNVRSAPFFLPLYACVIHYIFVAYATNTHDVAVLIRPSKAELKHFSHAHERGCRVQKPFSIEPLLFFSLLILFLRSARVIVRFSSDGGQRKERPIVSHCSRRKKKGFHT